MLKYFLCPKLNLQENHNFRWLGLEHKLISFSYISLFPFIFWNIVIVYLPYVNLLSDLDLSRKKKIFCMNQIKGRIFELQYIELKFQLVYI